MKAIQLSEYGPPENLKIVDIPIPDPGEDEVLIKVEAASVIFPDSLMRRGIYLNLPRSLPFIPGREVAGYVEKVGNEKNIGPPDIFQKVGAKPSNIKRGMRVMARMHTGGYAEYAIASLKNIICLPEKVPFLSGLVYNNNLRIAYLAYYIFGRIQPYDTILLHAASGGIGTLITQIAKRRGKNIVIGLASSDEKAEYCQNNGADYAINYKRNDYVEEVLRITGGKGVDVSLNSVAGPTLKSDPRVIKPLGRWVIYGSAAGRGPVDIYETMVYKSLTLSVFSVYTVLEREEYREATKFMENWLQTEKLSSVSKTFPLEEVILAHRLIDEQRSVGKIALVMQNSKS